MEQQHGVIPDRDAEFRLFDRVVNVRENFSVPVGLRGTIIGIKGGNNSILNMSPSTFILYVLYIYIYIVCRIYKQKATVNQEKH